MINMYLLFCVVPVLVSFLSGEERSRNGTFVQISPDRQIDQQRKN